MSAEQEFGIRGRLWQHPKLAWCACGSCMCVLCETLQLWAEMYKAIASSEKLCTQESRSGLVISTIYCTIQDSSRKRGIFCRAINRLNGALGRFSGCGYSFLMPFGFCVCVCVCMCVCVCTRVVVPTRPQLIHGAAFYSCAF